MTNLILFVIFIAHIYTQIYKAVLDIFFSFVAGARPLSPPPSGYASVASVGSGWSHNAMRIPLAIILPIPYIRHTTNETVPSITGCLPVFNRLKSSRLKFLGHLARSAPEKDHHRVIAAALRLPTDWRSPVGRSRTTWLRTMRLM